MQNAPASDEARALAEENSGDSGITLLSTPRRPPQMRCEFAASPLTKERADADATVRMPVAWRHFVAEKSGFDGYRAPSSAALQNAANNLDKSNGCRAKNGHPYPSGLSVPIDVLGRGCRWPGSRKLNPETWAKILWREACAP